MYSRAHIIIELRVGCNGEVYLGVTETERVKPSDGNIGKGRGLIHGDLKPSNILLRDNNSIAKIADYGLSKAFDLAGLRGLSVTRTHAAMPYFRLRQQIIDFNFK